MPRQARIVLPNCPHHIIQRGHNRQDVFTNDDYFTYYLDNLHEWKDKLNCKVYAYCLMTNHVHLVVDPGDNIETLGLLMKRIAARQTRYVNKLENRSGSLWEGRFKSAPIDSEEYLVQCCRYVELNPFRAGMVKDPSLYPWSSSNVKVGLKQNKWLDLDSFYMDLGETDQKRAEKYKEFLSDIIPDSELKIMREATQRGQLIGGKKFILEVSKKLNRQIELRGPGRPKNTRNG